MATGNSKCITNKSTVDKLSEKSDVREDRRRVEGKENRRVAGRGKIFNGRREVQRQGEIRKKRNLDLSM